MWQVHTNYFHDKRCASATRYSCTMSCLRIVLQNMRRILLWLVMTVRYRSENSSKHYDKAHNGNDRDFFDRTEPAGLYLWFNRQNPVDYAVGFHR